jgi:hypothetical protein
MAKMRNPGNQGLQSNKLLRPPPRDGKPATGVRPGYTDNLGNMRGTHVTDKGDMAAKLTPMQTVKPPISVPLGNAVATNVGRGGPGTGRTIYHTGDQGQHGAVNPGNRPMPTGPDPLAPWFPPSAARQSPIKK